MLTKLMDTGKAVDIVYFDFAKAFDKVPIKRLLAKCAGLGVQGDLLTWIEEWLTGRQLAACQVWCASGEGARANFILDFYQ